MGWDAYPPYDWGLSTGTVRMTPALATSCSSSDLGPAGLSITGTDGPDFLEGGSGSDTLLGLGGDDSLFGMSGDDLLDGGKGADDLSGGKGADTLLGGDGDDSLEADDGDDLLSGGAGENTIFGGRGLDTISYAALDRAVTANLGNGWATWAHGGDFLDGIENAVGSRRSDLLTGSNADNRLEGGDGGDTLDGTAGSDTLDGGRGRDTVQMSSLDGGVVIDLRAGVATSSKLTEILISIENATGSGLADLLVGSEGDNRLIGGFGDDTIAGGEGDDILVGGLGSNTLTYAGVEDGVTVNLDAGRASGGAGTDKLKQFAAVIGGGGADTLIGDAAGNSLNGGGGDDTVQGGRGADVLVGGDGQDTFRFKAVGDFAHTGADLIVDLANDDVIDVSAIDADRRATGNQAFTLVEAFSGHAGEITLAKPHGTSVTVILFDMNGDGQADASLEVSGDHRDFANFVL